MKFPFPTFPRLDSDHPLRKAWGALVDQETRFGYVIYGKHIFAP